MTASLLLISLAGFALVLALTPHGVGWSPDSVHYITVARNLLGGSSFTQWTGTPMVLWPPLYPTLLAPLFAAGDWAGVSVDILAVVRVLNAATLAAIVLASGLLLRRHVRTRTLVVLGTVAVLLSYPLAFVSSFAWSEPLFVLLCLGFFLILPAVLRGGARRALAALVILAALAALQRYVGLLLIGVGCVAIVLQGRGTLRVRIGAAAAFGLLSGLPIALFMARNYHLTGTLAGPRPAASRPLSTNINHAYEVVTAWFTPSTLGIGYLWAGVIGAVLLAVGAAVLYRRGGRAAYARLVASSPAPIALWVVAYTGFFIASATVSVMDPIDDRFLAPIVPFLLCLAFMALDAAAGALGRRVGHPWPVAAAVVLAALWLVYPADRLHTESTTIRAISEATRSTYDTWRHSDLMRAVDGRSFAGRVTSNAPVYTLLHAGIRTRPVPVSLDAWPTGDAATVIWFDALPACDFSRNYCIQTPYTVEELGALFAPEILIDAPDGTVVRLRPIQP